MKSLPQPEHALIDPRRVPLDIVQFRHAEDRTPVPINVALGDLLRSHDVRAAKDGPAFSPAIYRPGTTRKKVNVIAVTAIVYDLDHRPQEKLEVVRERLAGLAWGWYSTFSHHAGGEEDGCFRVVLPLSAPIPAGDYLRVWQYVNTTWLQGLADPATKDASRIHYLPTVPPARESEAVIEFHAGMVLDTATLVREASAPTHTPAPPIPDIVPEGQRHNTLLILAGRMRRGGASEDAMAAALLIENERCCVPPLGQAEVKAIAESMAALEPEQISLRQEPGREVRDEPPVVRIDQGERTEGDVEPPTERVVEAPAPHIDVSASGEKTDEPEPWPELDPAALSGLPGQIVETIAPKSEADPAAILFHVLPAAGALIGPGPHARVEYTRHPARFFVEVVGQTSKSRKGTAWSTPNELCRSVDPDWRLIVASGLSSGEGLIYHVRDPIYGVNKKGMRKLLDAGVSDKRLLIVESELAGAFARMLREGNSLTAVLRDAWDHGHLSTLTKQSPLRATGAHVNIVGHITEADLREYLTSTQMANGFGNRFLFCCAKRARLLPDGAAVDDLNLGPLVVALRRVLEASQPITVMRRDPEAAERWREVYPVLSRERDGLVGALLARGEAQVLRLSVLYALLDRSAEIRVAHLEAALAVWAYAEQSVLYLFAGRLGHPVADTILAALDARSRMTRTEISDLFNRNVPAQQIEEALRMLERAGLARRVPPDRETPGRPAEVWERIHAYTKKTR
jgi:hypothetical protein